MVVPLHRIRFSWGANTHVDIEWSKGRGVVLPNFRPTPLVQFCEQELELDEYTARGIPPIAWREDSQALFEPFQLRENTDYYIDITLPITKEQAIQHSQAHQGWPFSPRLAPVFKSDPSRRWQEPVPGSVVISGRLQLRNHAGVLDLSTQYGGPLKTEIVCRKLNYFTEFKTMLDEVAEEMTELLLSYDSPASLLFTASSLDSSNLAGLLFQMRYVMADENLPLALDEIFEQFHSTLTSSLSYENISGIEEPSIETLVDELDISSFHVGGPLSTLFRGYTPQELPVNYTSEVTNTPENRYVKYFLEECLQVADWLSTNLTSQGKSAAREARGWAEQLEDILSHDVWRDVGPFEQFPTNSQVLMKRRGYREILRFDLALRLSLELPWKHGAELADGLLGDVRPVNQIYEYWCFLLLRRTISELCTSELPNQQSFIYVSSNQLRVKLRKGKRSRISFLYKKEGNKEIRVSLYYNRRFKRPNRPLSTWEGSYTASFDPDFSVIITVTEGRARQKHWLHFDAKYRLETKEVRDLFSRGSFPDLEEDEGDNGEDYITELTRFYRREDLHKMHTYRDGILSTRGAYILFPGDATTLHLDGSGQRIFVRNPLTFGGTPTHLVPGVGAIDLCPGQDMSQLPMLRDFLSAILQSIASAGNYQEETGLFE